MAEYIKDDILGTALEVSINQKKDKTTEMMLRYKAEYEDKTTKIQQLSEEAARLNTVFHILRGSDEHFHSTCRYNHSHDILFSIELLGIYSTFANAIESLKRFILMAFLSDADLYW